MHTINPSTQSSIFPLFSTPVYYVQDTKFRIDSTLLTSLVDTSLFPNWNDECGLTKEMFIFDQPELKDVRRVCEYHLQEYITKVCAFSNEFYITNSWLSRNAPGVPHTSHVHPNSIFSGCLYLHSSANSMLTFSSPTHFDKHWPFTYSKTAANIYNSASWPVSVDTGTIAIWPSNVLHESSPNPLNDTRVVACFNTFMRGDIGAQWYGTDLILK